MSEFQTAKHRPHRFFVTPESIRRGQVTIDGQQAHQIVNVLRLGAGERIVILDNSGWQYDVEIASAQDGEVSCQVRAKSLVSTEPRTKITLYQGLLRPNAFEFVLQKCTELGVAAFVPVITERCVVGNIEDTKPAKMDRWRRIIAEAAEQSGRGKVPALRPATLFQQACEEVRGTSLIAWESVKDKSVRTVLGREGIMPDGNDGESIPRPFTVNLFVGPEGGFSAAEVQAARAYGIQAVGLGARILRAETAAVVATSLTLYEVGDMEPRP